MTLPHIFEKYFENADITFDVLSDELENFEASMKMKYIPGALEFIKELKAHDIKLAIVTSRLKSSTETGLYKFDIANQFDAFVSCEDTDKHKPDPTPCLIALDKLGVKAEEAVMIGDSKYDIQCAHNAGIKAVLVNWTICLPEEQRVGLNVADWVVDKAEEILDIL